MLFDPLWAMAALNSPADIGLSDLIIIIFGIFIENYICYLIEIIFVIWSLSYLLLDHNYIWSLSYLLSYHDYICYLITIIFVIWSWLYLFLICSEQLLHWTSRQTLVWEIWSSLYLRIILPVLFLFPCVVFSQFVRTSLKFCPVCCVFDEKGK